MKQDYQSCLISRLSRFVTLTDAECAFIADLEKDEQKRKKGRPVVSVGEATDGIMVLKSGWAVVKADSSDGRSQILRVYLPGEVMGLAELGTSHAHHRIVMQTDGMVCPFPRKGLAPLFIDFPRLAALLTSVGSLDQIALRHHAGVLGSLDAAGKLKSWLLQLRSRLEVANVGLGNRFQVPFSQVEIGQAVGLTSIYVNKLLRRFVENGEMEIDRPYVRLLKRDEWEKECEYVDAFVNMDTSWFPPAIGAETTGTAQMAEPV
ncbi:Fumarate and nitrate reduction regulatory protein [Roseobacter fucihabitans]|uniref:Fumarate and nitrate reduction regulatory protein n=1 Tax=Roseobacter fucihabitans TaxID=1537242 RepID=A0ABZ2BV32_9RHOB|nr:Crp/Fnr family transcriptional regulator [Roseobacter litoralis]MBC6967210.1 Fumarate and nitrate reduction regulatory protein [Roseobacter litoralis]